MPTPSSAIVPLLAAFAPAFTAPTFAHGLVLVYGTLLASGRRTVTAALRAVGLQDERHFTTYHRVLNQVSWSPLPLSKVLLGLIVTAFLSADEPLLLVIDDTLERRYGRHIAYKGRYHDAVRSTSGHTATCSGIRWLCVCDLIRVPWSHRSWALPFLTVPSPTPATSRRLRKQHRTAPECAAVLMRLIRRWQPDRAIVLVGDSGYGVVSLAETCRQRQVTLVMRLTAALYGPVPPQPAGKPGVKPKKGPRLPTPGPLLKDPDTMWESVEVPWYGGEIKSFEMVSDTALWPRDGEPPVPIRWVLLRDPTTRLKPVVLGCTAQDATPLQIVTWYVGRWNSEVTFEESRCHLDMETQRQWSRRATEGTIPCLLGMFSLVTLMAHALHDDHLPIRQSAWYAKEEATFTDALAAVRRHLWTSYLANPPTSTYPSGAVDSPALFLSSLVEVACYAA